MLNIYRKGFTIIELVIVIAVIGILATLSTVGYKGMQMRAADTTSKSDGVNAAEQIELAFLKAGKFPLNESELSTYKKDAKTDWDYVTNTTNTAYCLEVWNTLAGAKHFTVRDDTAIKEGTCTGWVPSSGSMAPPAPGQPIATTGAFTANSFSVTWPAVSGATSYAVRYGTSTPSITAGCTSSPCTITGLASNTTYYVIVTASNSGGSTPSSQVSATTSAAAAAYAGPAPESIEPCVYQSAAYNIGWSTSPYAVRSHLYIPDDGTGNEVDLDILPSNGMYSYDLGWNSNGGNVYASVYYIDANGRQSATTSMDVRFYGGDCYN